MEDPSSSTEKVSKSYTAFLTEEQRAALMKHPHVFDFKFTDEQLEVRFMF
jgi:hypothetical protein